MPRSHEDPASTLVIASCDPAAGFLADEYAKQTGLRLIVLARPSRQALTMLRDGLVHAAGVHFATADEPDANSEAVRDLLGPGHALLRLADVQEGLAFAPGREQSSVGAAVRSALRWVGREDGSAAKRCLDEILPDTDCPNIARDHRGVATALQGGWADVGVCPKVVAEEAGLRFLPVRAEGFDLCYPSTAGPDPRLAALTRVVRSAAYRRLLADLPGFDAGRTGELSAA